MTEQDKENIRNYCRNLADNWINGEYNQSYVTIGIDENGFLKSIETKTNITENIKEQSRSEE